MNILFEAANAPSVAVLPLTTKKSADEPRNPKSFNVASDGVAEIPLVSNSNIALVIPCIVPPPRPDVREYDVAAEYLTEVVFTPPGELVASLAFANDD